MDNGGSGMIDTGWVYQDVSVRDLGVQHRASGSGKIIVCVDFWDLNRATLKDPMRIADDRINKAHRHKVIRFLDGNAGYNQIFMADEDVAKTGFWCPGFVGLLE
jgi:hypothetical protein